MRPKKWFYVMCEAPKDELAMISFSHHIVYGHSKEEAYQAGFKEFAQAPKNDGHQFLNDYVIQISGVA